MNSKLEVKPPIELTAAGQALETAVLKLGKWGSRWLPASLEGIALSSLGAITLAIKAFFHPDQAQGVDETYELRFGTEALQGQIKGGELQVRQGQALKPDAVLLTVFFSPYSSSPARPCIPRMVEISPPW